MKRPANRILILNDEKLVFKGIHEGLNTAAKSMENPLEAFCRVKLYKKHFDGLSKMVVSKL